MKIVLNGEDYHFFGEDNSVLGLFDSIKLSQDHKVVEINGEIVLPSDFLTYKICLNDKVEILHFLGGG